MLTEYPIKLNEKFIINFTKNNKNLKKEAKETCKVLHFQSEWIIDDILVELTALNPKDYQNLFIFIIKAPLNAENVLKVPKNLLKFSSSRPLVLQLTSDDENVTKFYYKDENSTQFGIIDHSNDFRELKDFPSFLCSFLRGTFGNPSDFEDRMLEILPQLRETSLIYKFLYTLNLSDEFYGSLILKVSENGTKSDFIAALDAPFDCDGRMLSPRAQKYLSDLFYEDQSDDESVDDSKQEDESAARIEDEDQQDKVSETSSNSHLSPSVFLTAVEHKNKEVIDYLITFWTHLIQQLPLKHQIRISTAAFNSSQLNVLCDLLDIADYSFPESFQVESVEHENLVKIATERTQLSVWTKDENLEKIDEFIDSKMNLKIIYNLENKSAMKQAVNLKKFNVYWHLKSFGFKATEFDELEEILSKNDLKLAIQAKVQQRRKNVNESLTGDDMSVNHLCNRSSIHNKRIGKEQQTEYHKKIRNWFKDIKKIKFGSEFLDVAASCDNLKIIFDFESNTVENASLTGPHSLGSTYPISKWIFIGAKLTDSKREQRIKGVLAHELCHYVMRLVYENQENPYYKHMLKMAEMFKEIVKAIDKWSGKDAECPDDECNGIISSVFTLYSKDEHQLELIVRVVQILVEFADDEDKLKYLEDKYKILFDFWEQQVIPELQKFNLKDREAVRKMNRIFELLPSIRTEKLKFCKPKDIKSMVDNKLVIMTSNVPKLLLINIHEHLKEEHGDLFDTKTVFVDPKKLKNQEICSDFTRLLDENLKLTIIIDCSNEFPQDLSQFGANEESRLVFVDQNENDCKSLKEKLKKFKGNSTKLDINYSWTDLTEESQNLLLQTRVNFQNNSTVLLKDLLNKEGTTKPQDLASTIDPQFLNFLVLKTEIKVNQQDSNKADDERFRVLFMSRDFIKNFTVKEPVGEEQAGISSNSHKVQQDQHSKQIDQTLELTQEELLDDVQNQKFILISEKAGSGKSWILKKFVKMLKEKYPTKWVTYVDLKQFISEFRAQKTKPEFLCFFVDQILKPKFNFEAKIFKNCYKNGKVLILFDGFDEIAPDCAEFVSELAKSFEFNDGNQLWIATRDYFEVNLKEKLKLDVVYHLSEFTEEDGAHLIVSIWMLNSALNGTSKNEDLSEKYDRYMIYAKYINKVELTFTTQSIGLPQFYTMIAETYDSTKESRTKLTILNVYSKFVWMQYERWAYKKGELRKNDSIRQQKKALNYYQVHQLIAMQSFFPDKFKFCDLSIEKLDWLDEEIVACGLLFYKNGKFFFTHETLREFFAAEFIVRILTNEDIDEDFCNFFIEFLAEYKYRIIREFIDQMLGDDTTWKKFDLKIPKIAELFCKNKENAKNLRYVSSLLLNNLTDFLIVVLKSGNYKDVKFILNQNPGFLVEASTTFDKVQDFIVSQLSVSDLKDFVLKNKVVHGIFAELSDVDSIERFFDSLSDKVGRKFIKKVLKLDTLKQDNLLFAVIDAVTDAEEFSAVFKILPKFLTNKEVINLTKGIDHYARNILHVCISNDQTEKLKFVWAELKKLFCTQSSIHFKNMLLRNYRIFKDALKAEKMEIYETFWKLVLNTFEDREVVKYMIMLTDKDANNLVHFTLNYSQKIVYIFTVFKDYFNADQFKKVLMAKGHLEANLLFLAVEKVKFVEIFKFLWNLIFEAFESADEFKKYLLQVDYYNDNFFHYVVKFSNAEILEFVIDEFGKISTREEIKKILKISGKANFNILQTAGEHNFQLEIHKSLWNLIEKFLEPQEVLEMIQHTNRLGEHLFFSFVCHNYTEVVEFTWNQIKKYISTKDEQAKYLKKRGFVFMTLKFQINSLPDPNTKAREWFNDLIKEYE